MKKYLHLLFNTFMCLFLGAVMVPFFGTNALLLSAALFLFGLMPVKLLPNGSFGAPVVLTELFTGELIKKFRYVGKWLSAIPSQDNYVNNNVIHMVDVGADPNVLINNTAYPIATASRADDDIAVSLRKFDTENTKITDDELYALSYDKIASVVEQHRAVLEEKTAQYGLFSLAPAGNTTNTPLISTTGGDNGASRKRMTIADITLAKKRLDDLKVPYDGRILILCSDHINDLLNLDQSFRDRFYNTKSGEPLDFMGFRIFEDMYNPVYDAANTKRAWGAASAGTDRNASVFMYAPRAFKAMGTVKMYYRDSTLSPELRESVAGFRLYHAVLPKKSIGFGAIVSVPFP